MGNFEKLIDGSKGKIGFTHRWRSWTEPEKSPAPVISWSMMSEICTQKAAIVMKTLSRGSYPSELSTHHRFHRKWTLNKGEQGTPQPSLSAPGPHPLPAGC